MKALAAVLNQEQTNKRIWIARGLAVTADAIQLALLPFAAVGFVNPLVTGLDIALAVAMIALLGWHWAFLPTFVAEAMPVFGLVPTWTAAVWLATRGRTTR